MPLIIFILVMLIIADEACEFILPYLPFLTPDEWLAVKITVLAAIYMFGDKYQHDRIKGTFTEKGIAIRSGSKIIPWGDIAFINGKILNGKPFYLDTRLEISDGTTVTEASISGRNLTSLIRTRLNQWFIKEESFEIKTSERGPALIEYAPIGKYALPIGYWAFDWYFALAAFIGEESGMLGFFQPLFVSLTALFSIKFIIGKGLDWYQRVRIILTSNDIGIYDTDGFEESLQFSDVARIEKGIFTVKVTGKSGQIILLPRGCYLLPELITELCGQKKAEQAF